MTHRERLLTVMARKSPDRIPWFPRLLMWYNAHKLAGTLPDRYREWSLRDIERDLNLGTPAREGTVFTTMMHGVETRVQQDGADSVTEYITPVGTVSTRRRGSDELRRAGIGSLEIEHPIKRPEDYDVVAYMVENTEYAPAYESYMAYEQDIGDEGVPMVAAGHDPMHRIMRAEAGYNRFFYDIYDHPERVERLYRILYDKMKELWPILAESPARLILHGVHFDSVMTPPPLFEKYFTPYFQEFNACMHAHDKVVAFHADADSRLLLDAVVEAGFDMAECFTCSPMVACTLVEAQQAWRDRIIIWGGIPSTILCDPVSDEEFEAYMDELFTTIAPGNGIILGIGDNAMPEAKIERIIRIGEMVEERGWYPSK